MSHLIPVTPSVQTSLIRRGVTPFRYFRDFFALKSNSFFCYVSCVKGFLELCLFKCGRGDFSIDVVRGQNSDIAFLLLLSIQMTDSYKNTLFKVTRLFFRSVPVFMLLICTGNRDIE